MDVQAWEQEAIDCHTNRDLAACIILLCQSWDNDSDDMKNIWDNTLKLIEWSLFY